MQSFFLEMITDTPSHTSDDATQRKKYFNTKSFHFVRNYDVGYLIILYIGIVN